MPRTAATMMTHLPVYVCGVTSPYPTVVNVIMVKYSDANSGLAVLVAVDVIKFCNSKSNSHHQIHTIRKKEVIITVFNGFFSFLILKMKKFVG